MSITTYSDQLDRQLAAGVSLLGPDFLSSQSRWLIGAQNPDGGFPNRAGETELYYTGFGVRAADLLSLSDSHFWSRLYDFLYNGLHDLRDPADVLSFLVIKRALDRHGLKACCPECEQLLLDDALASLARFHHPAGGYRKTLDSPVSLYATFLSSLCFELVNQPFPSPDELAPVVLAHRGSHGGFSDLPAQPEGTNPTAAALALVSMFSVGDLSLLVSSAAFLRNMQRPDGGFASASKSPTSDLMSTFTAMVTLSALSSFDSIKLGPLGRFVRDRATPAGGFAGVPGDPAADVEYTYYGLGTLSLLACRVREVKCAPHQTSTP